MGLNLNLQEIIGIATSVGFKYTRYIRSKVEGIVTGVSKKYKIYKKGNKH